MSVVLQGRPTHCECCGRQLSHRGRAKTGLCTFCRSAGSRFLAAWLTDLKTGGLTPAAAADVAGIGAQTARARMREHHARQRAAHG